MYLCVSYMYICSIGSCLKKVIKTPTFAKLRIIFSQQLQNHLNSRSQARRKASKDGPPASFPKPTCQPYPFETRLSRIPPPKSKSETHERRNGETIGTLDLSRPSSRTLDPPCTSPEPATRQATAPAAAGVAVEAATEEEAVAEITTTMAETRSRSSTTTTTSTSSRRSSNSSISSLRIGTPRISTSSGCGATRPLPPPRGLEMLRGGRRRISTPQTRGTDFADLPIASGEPCFGLCLVRCHPRFALCLACRIAYTHHAEYSNIQIFDFGCCLAALVPRFYSDIMLILISLMDQVMCLEKGT